MEIWISTLLYHLALAVMLVVQAAVKPTVAAAAQRRQALKMEQLEIWMILARENALWSRQLLAKQSFFLLLV
jgi:hypothetical protein